MKQIKTEKDFIAAVTALPWRPIETAPKPSPRCLVYCPDQSPEMQVLIVPQGMLKTKTDATHWMPLPEPPE